MKTPNTHELPPALRASIDKAAREAAASFHGAGQRSIWTAFRSAASFQKGSASPACFFSATTAARWPIQKAVKCSPKSNQFTTACLTGGCIVSFRQVCMTMPSCSW